MTYEVRILRSAEKEMDALPAATHRRVSQRILSLEENPRPRGARRLSERGEYRLRIGDYRLLYLVDDANKTVTICTLGHCRDVYR